jgi:protein SCO1
MQRSFIRQFKYLWRWPGSVGLLAGVVSAHAQNATVQVLASDPKAYTLTVKGVGLPEPGKDGTEVLKVALGDAEVAYAGHQVQGELSKSEGQWRLDNVWPADPAVISAAADGEAQLHRDQIELGRAAIRGVGDTLPAFALYNQNGEVVRPETLRGRRLVINFIFTRCANPDMCPANTQRMAQLQKQVKAAKIENITFVTITIDPEHDTPGALRQYADAYGLDLSNYQLLTGPADEMADTLQQFGILTKEENGTLTHTFATLIVSPQGRITYRKDTDLWSVDEFFDRLKPPVPAPADKAPGS